MMSSSRRAFSLHRQRGISNIQIMIGALISAIMVLGGMGMIRMIDQAKVDNDLRDLADFKEKTVHLAAQHGSMVDVTQEYVIDLGFFPATDVSGPVGSRIIASRWKGNLSVTPNNYLAAGDSLVFATNGVPTAACKLLGMQATNIADAILVNGTLIKLSKGGGGTGFVNEAALISRCDAGSDNSTISFVTSKY